MFAMNLVTCIGIACYRKIAKKVPTNYIFLFLFTISESYLVSLIASMYNPEVVLSAAILTVGITLSLTIYAITTKRDFTMMDGALFIVLMAFMLMSFIMWAFGHKIGYANIIYCTLGVIIFGFYLIYDI